MMYCQKGKIYQMGFSRDLSLPYYYYSKILLTTLTIEIRNKTIKMADDTSLE